MAITPIGISVNSDIAQLYISRLPTTPGEVVEMKNVDHDKRRQVFGVFKPVNFSIHSEGAWLFKPAEPSGNFVNNVDLMQQYADSIEEVVEVKKPGNIQMKLPKPPKPIGFSIFSKGAQKFKPAMKPFGDFMKSKAANEYALRKFTPPKVKEPKTVLPTFKLNTNIAANWNFSKFQPM